MDRRAIGRTGLLFGAVSGVFALAVLLVSFYIVREESPLTFIAGAVLELLIIGEAGRVLGRQMGRVAAGGWTGAIAGGVSELIKDALGRVAFLYSPAGQAAHHALSPAGWALLTDPPYIAQSLLVSVVSLIVFGALYGGLGAWSEVRAKQP